MGQTSSIHPHNIKPKPPTKSKYNSKLKDTIVTGILVEEAATNLINDVVVGIKVEENKDTNNEPIEKTHKIITMLR